jgi:hypothetical protein
MLKLLALMLAMCIPNAYATDEMPPASLDTTMNTEPVTVSATMSAVEQKVRAAAVRVMSSGGGHGSGSLVKYKGLTLLFTAHHVADDPLGSVYYAMRGEEIRVGVLIYADPVHDMSVIYMMEEFNSVKPLKYSPREEIIEVGSEITYSGYPSSHKLMTFRGRVAGYETLPDAGIQVLLHTHGWFGCSGSMVYDENGDIVGILWGVDVEYQPSMQVIGNLVWIQPIQAFDIDRALGALCRSVDIKARACR